MVVAVVYQSGVAVIKVGVDVDMNALRKALADKAWRRTFVQQSMDLSPNQIQVCIGIQCLAPEDDLAAAMVHL